MLKQLVKECKAWLEYIGNEELLSWLENDKKVLFLGIDGVLNALGKIRSIQLDFSMVQ